MSFSAGAVDILGVSDPSFCLFVLHLFPPYLWFVFMQGGTENYIAPELLQQHAASLPVPPSPSSLAAGGGAASAASAASSSYASFDRRASDIWWVVGIRIFRSIKKILGCAFGPTVILELDCLSS